MRNLNLRGYLRLICVGTLFGISLIPAVASAALPIVINSWSDPTPFSFYAQGADVIVNATYAQLPPTFLVNINVHLDGNDTPLPDPYYAIIANPSSSNPSSGSFTITLNSSLFSPGVHTIQLEAAGGTPGVVGGNDKKDSGNWLDQSTPVRKITKSLSPDPVLHLSYDSQGNQAVDQPAFNFLTVPVGSPDTRRLWISNVGSGVAQGQVVVSGGADPFFCTSPGACNFSVAAGAPAMPIDIQYAPQTAGLDSAGSLYINCTSANCLDVTTGLHGTSVAGAVTSGLSLSLNRLDFGAVNVGQSLDIPVKISNTGSGIISGAIGFGNPAYSCGQFNPTCQYSVQNGNPVTLTVQFSPTAVGSADTNATFGAPTPVIIPVTGTGNDSPIVSINCVGADCTSPLSWNVTVQAGEVRYTTVEIRNIGAGTLSGVVGPASDSVRWNINGFHCIGVTQNGVTTDYTDASPCRYSGLQNDGSVAYVNLMYINPNPGAHNDNLEFRDDSNAYDKQVLHMNATITLDPQLQVQVGSGVFFPDTLLGTTVNNYDPSPWQNPVILTNTGVISLTAQVKLPPVQGITCALCNTDIVLAGGASQEIKFVFTPQQTLWNGSPFSVCLGANCADYTVGGYGVDPEITIVPGMPLAANTGLPGGGNMDPSTECADEGAVCQFTGTKTVYFGNSVNSTSRQFTNGVACIIANFPVDPVPGAPEYCWIPNDLPGTWVNQWLITHVPFRVKNAGTGGSVVWRIIDYSPNFVCDKNKSDCSGAVSNLAAQSGGTSNPFLAWFNPKVGNNTNISENLVLEYNYIGEPGTPTSCPGGVAQFCSTISIPLSGTGLSGPHISYTVTPFPTTNVSNTSPSTMTLRNDGTDTLSDVNIGDGTGPFHCTSFCNIPSFTPGSTITVGISYTATVGSAESGSLIVNSPDLTSPLTVPMSGTGNSGALIRITPNSNGVLIYDTLTQGDIEYSGEGIASIFVTNDGVAALTGDAVITSDALKNFSCNASRAKCHYENLKQGGTFEVKIAFAPQEVGNPLTAVVNFSGGGGAVLNLQGGSVLGGTSISGSDTDFGKVLVHSGNYKDQVVTVSNFGTIAIPAGTITFSGSSVFSCISSLTPKDPVTGRCTYPAIAANGGSVTFTIRFAPAVAGPASGYIRFSGASGARLHLTGVGTSPSVKFKEN